MGCNLSLPGRGQSGRRFNHFSPLVNGDEEDEVRAEQSLFSERCWTAGETRETRETGEVSAEKTKEYNVISFLQASF